MPFDDRNSDGGLDARSLSEQLRDLEAQLGPESGQEHDLSLPRRARRSTLPTHLGRPIGLTRLDGFPRVGRLIADRDAGAHQPKLAPSPGAAFRRGATVVGVGLLLLATTAIVPPLFLRHPAPVATQPSTPAKIVTVARTERFAQSAQELRDAGPAAVASQPPSRPAQLRAAPVWSVITPDPILSRPTAHYEPTAAEGEAMPDPFVLPPPH